MKIPVEVSEHGNLLMYKSSYTAEDVKHLLVAQDLGGLRIFDHWDPLRSTEFLRDFTFLIRLELAFRYDQDYSFLEDLPQLEHLTIGSSVPSQRPIDLSRQANLKYLSLTWRKNRIFGLDSCQNLRDLCLVEFKSDDLKPVSNLRKLRRLRLKTGSIKTLHGVEGLKALEEIEMGNCHRLSAISSINGLANLRTLKIQSCRNIADYAHLRDLPLLTTVQLIDCGEIAALDLERFPTLLDFKLLGRTKVR